MIIECPHCCVEMEYSGIEERREGRNEVYECPQCGEQMRRWLFDIAGYTEPTKQSTTTD